MALHSTQSSKWSNSLHTEGSPSGNLESPVCLLFAIAFPLQARRARVRARNSFIDLLYPLNEHPLDPRVFTHRIERQFDSLLAFCTPITPRNHFRSHRDAGFGRRRSFSLRGKSSQPRSSSDLRQPIERPPLCLQNHPPCNFRINILKFIRSTEKRLSRRERKRAGR